MQADKRKVVAFLVYMLAGVLLFTSAFIIMLPTTTLAESYSLEITGDGVSNPVKFTLKDLEKMEQHQVVYSCINTWPSKRWYVGRGVKLWDLLVRAGIKEREAKLIRFTAVDGYTVVLTMKELFHDERYCFPNFKKGSESEGHIPGDPSGKVKVEPIIALVNAEGTNNPEYMNDLNCPMLMLGQRTVTEQTGNLFVKYLNKIEVLTDEPEKWDPPQANPGSGTVPPGTMVTLSIPNDDDAKIYYTLDGSDPNLNSPMYNWISRRWWSARADVLGKINRPIGPIYEDTIIKAITIGPGKLDSDIVTFTYQVADVKPSLKVIQLTPGSIKASIDGVPYTLDTAPYLNTEVGRALVPLRFVSEALGAKVTWDGETRRVIITDEEKKIVLTVGSSDVLVNGMHQTIDCAPVILPPGRTFIPLRFVSETLGAAVDYNPKTREITIAR
ncbi:chitobiase/beta-hexosaminidase C-terminal domain-containing protein [Thermovorax subterraneus]|nr:chitobiase/beta-hexosaminidase C-terminal domain-containing protein [Thermovorax subterraneus]